MFIERSRRLFAPAQVAGIDGVQMDGAEALFQCSDLTESVFRQVAVVMSVEAAVEVALCLRMADDVYFCHVWSLLSLCGTGECEVAVNWNLLNFLSGIIVDKISPCFIIAKLQV